MKRACNSTKGMDAWLGFGLKMSLIPGKTTNSPFWLSNMYSDEAICWQLQLEKLLLSSVFLSCKFSKPFNTQLNFGVPLLLGLILTSNLQYNHVNKVRLIVLSVNLRRDILILCVFFSPYEHQTIKQNFLCKTFCSLHHCPS